jgi:peptidyl-prolyl cis-trans isomerase SurA
MRVLLLTLLFALPTLAGPVLVDRVVATVDGELVFLSQVERRVALLKGLPQSARAAALVSAREELIDALLIAKDARFTATDAEVDAALDALAKENRLDRAGLEAVVRKEGLELAEYRDQLREQLAEMRWLMSHADGAPMSTGPQRRALRERLVAQLRKRAVIEVLP